MTIQRIGLAQNVQDINVKAGSIYLALRNTLQDVKNFQAMLGTLADADLQSADQNGKAFTAAEITTLKSAFTDLDQLRQVFEGTATRTPAYDYRTFAKLLGGVG